MKYIIVLFICFYSGLASAGVISKDYQSVGDGLITIDTVGQKEWLDVTETRSIQFQILQGANQWTDDGFRLATDDEVQELFINAGSLYGFDYVGNLSWGDRNNVSRFGELYHAHESAITTLLELLGGGVNHFDGAQITHGLLVDDNNDGFSNLASIGIAGERGPFTDLNDGGDIWGGNGSSSDVAAFFVRDIPEPFSLGLILLGLLVLTATSYKRYAL
ncbi:hypothetical protein [Aliiglaciecola litoralis]|uniref:PEP-CTERM protein-sorting domain-containing protein n=1 Tax=Aliiglaciecola litoralis TaxID=582857 RepID=A0ABP3WS82_9ALTE